MQVKDHMPDQVINNYKMFTNNEVNEENILKINDTIVKYLYTGIVSDTDRFLHYYTTIKISSTMKILIINFMHIQQ